MSFFYAVALGHNIGIFTKWDDCKKNIEGFSNPIYKKFDNEDLAKEFINDFSNNIYVYTDGACSNNGNKNAKAGIGIYFSKDNDNNVSEKLEGENLTNNIAELMAVIRAINILKKMENIENKNKIIVTDSTYVIKCATNYGEKLAKNNWLTLKDKQPPPNVELVKRLYELTNKYNIQYKHIEAHTDKKDRHSIGNYFADKLANQSILEYINDCSTRIEPSKIETSRIYLNVPYSKKDNAKSLGACWDPTKKSWYIYNDNQNKDKLIETYKK